MAAGFPRRGEVWLVDFPEDPKSRPALIISTDMRNEFANSIPAVPITTNLRPAPTHVAIPAGQRGLSHDSMARCENVSYLHKSRLRRGRFSGTLNLALLRQIENCLLIAFSIAM